MNIYDIKVVDSQGNLKDLSEYKGKVLLVVNTATECGFTPQYENLQSIYNKYNSNGLEILDFPCNQFGNQAPGSQDEIYEFCTSRFGVTFDQFQKVEVNGENEAEIFKFLKSEKTFKGFDLNHKLGLVLDKRLSETDPKYKETSDIKWNFTKFLIGKDGSVLERFEPTTDMTIVEKAVTEALEA